MKYKIGDKLKVKEGCETICFNYYDNRGGYVIIKDIINNNYRYEIYNCEGQLVTGCTNCLKDEHLEPFEERKKDISDITTYEVGDVLVDREGYEKILLGICDKVIFLSALSDFNDYGGAYTIEQLIRYNYSFKTPTPKPTEEETKAKELLEGLGYKIEK